MKEHVVLCNSMTHWRVFNHLWTVVELCDLSGLCYILYIILVMRKHSLLGLVFSHVDTESYQTCALKGDTGFCMP